MNKHDLQKEKLDQLGRKLLKTTRVTKDEIERVVSAPHLFEAVQARIKAEEDARRQPKEFFNVWANFISLNRQNAILAAATLLILSAFATAIVLKKYENQQVVQKTNKPEIKLETAPLEYFPPAPKIEAVKAPAIENYQPAEKISFKTEKPKAPNRQRKQNLRESANDKAADGKKQTPEVFYSLTVDGNWKDDEYLRIVRAEISKSELFALGMNVSVENESARVKTDLLVGADGVPRAIRFVE